MVKERCWFSQINFFIGYFPHPINIVFFPANFMSNTDKNNLFRDEGRDIPNLEFSPIHVSKGLSQLAFPIIVLPKEDRTDFLQKE